MKKLLFLILLPLLSCHEEKSTQPVVTAQIYYFGAVNFRYEDYGGKIVHKVVVSDVQSGNPTMDDKYRIMDNISNSVYITINKNYNIEKREVFTFSTYTDASIKRQEILKTRIP